MHRFNKDARMLRVNVLMDTVAEVKDVAFPLTKAGEDGRDFFFNTRGGRIEHALPLHLAAHYRAVGGDAGR